ncbi:MAPEG family protein [Leptospira broomii serovar Hurstbridge str. 5399]|uniref:MAPEG family protein n=1 Tax=Leptospira broomii serovar Hurstbridge str. 5399 TaxID=1049789 RepID=T0GCB8_9LEPT|nr:MAPEG family protein [Leptospira broomii]EQA44474.1 MAPEG family protein [Leptospira broomii serovar Hurstbridge str. 5399]
MQNHLILFPVGALGFLTFFVVLLIPIRRFKAAFSGKVTAEDFKYGESKRVPPWVSIPNRNYMNLLEAPMLFYVICTILYVANSVNLTNLVLAWVYVILRILHSFVHLTFNHIFCRLGLFAASNFVLAAMWAIFFFTFL